MQRGVEPLGTKLRNTLFSLLVPLSNRWRFIFNILFLNVILYFLVVSSFSICHNVLALGEEADFEALNCLSALNLIRSTKLHLSTESAFLPNACYVLCFYFFPLLCLPVLNIFNAVSCCLLVSLLVAIDKAK